jgi:hypothetical protein
MPCSVEANRSILRVERWRVRRLAGRSIFGLLLLASFASQTAAQNSDAEFWPVIKTYISLSTGTRLFILTGFRDIEGEDTRSWRGDFGVHFDFALKPIFRRELAAREDVFEKRFLSFLTGYRYITSLSQGGPPEHRWLVEMTARYPMRGKLVLSDRSRGEMRFLSSGFSTRYRNRLQAERDLNPGGFRFTPYASAETFFDTRFDTWNRMRYIFGVRFPARGHFILDTYYLRQNDSKSTPQHVNALGVTFNLFF